LHFTIAVILLHMGIIYVYIFTSIIPYGVPHLSWSSFKYDVFFISLIIHLSTRKLYIGSMHVNYMRAHIAELGFC